MDVQYAATEGVHDLRPDDPHEPGQRDAVDAFRLQKLSKRVVVRRVVGMRFGIQDDSLHVPRSRSLQCERVGPVRDHENDPGSDDRIVKERLEIGPPAGGQHRHLRLHAREGMDRRPQVSNMIGGGGSVRPRPSAPCRPPPRPPPRRSPRPWGRWGRCSEGPGSRCGARVRARARCGAGGGGLRLGIGSPGIRQYAHLGFSRARHCPRCLCDAHAAAIEFLDPTPHSQIHRVQARPLIKANPSVHTRCRTCRRSHTSR